VTEMKESRKNSKHGNFDGLHPRSFINRLSTKFPVNSLSKIKSSHGHLPYNAYHCSQDSYHHRQTMTELTKIAR